jgi:hypothetical protein
MEMKKNIPELILMLLCCLFGVGVIMLLLAKWWGVIFLAIGGVMLYTGFKKIPASPPNVGLITIWGERIDDVKKEGWRLFAPFFPFFYDAILVDVEKKEKDFLPEDVRSQEKAELEINNAITWTPDKDVPKNLKEYLNVGGKEGVEKILKDIIGEACRQYAIGRGWEEVLDTRDELAMNIIKALTGESGKRAERLRESLKRGNGVAKIPSLGIVLNRFNVGRIKVIGELGKDAEKIALEKRQMGAETVEIQHVRERTKEMMEIGLSAKDAVEVVQTERAKVKKDIKEFKFGGVGEIAEGIAKILGKK